MRFNLRSRPLLLFAALILQLGAVATAAPVVQGAIEIGQGITLWSEVLNESRPLQIHLPASYEKSRARYPVLYLLDGDRNFLHAVGAVEFLADGGRIPEHIVISIPNVDRTRDLTPCREGGESCGADKFLRFLAQELIPWVDKEYRTERFRTLVGHSRGGQFAFYTLFNQPDTFNGYIAISPALWINDAAIFDKAAAQLGKLPAQRFLYFSDGNESVDITANVTRMVGVLKQHKPAAVQWSNEHFGDDQHATTPHKSLYNGLQRIFSGLNVDREVILSQGLAGVDAHYAKLEARYGFKIEPPRGMLEWMGYFLLQQDRPAAALAFFERDVQRFPNETSAYEALASGLEAVGRHEEAAATHRAATDDVTRRVDEIFKEWARPDSPGCSVAASQNGNIVLERGYGMADLEQGVAIRPDTVFNIASVSKQFTAASLLLLQEQGKLSLSDDVRKYVPELPDYGQRITLRHLANHTSGLRDLPTLLALGGWNWVDAVPSEQALDLISRQQHLNFAPGSKHSYSNTGYYLMALIVERVSGQRFGEFTQQQIFQPLGMLHSRFYDDRRMIMKNRAIGHVKLEGGGFGVWRPTYEIVGDGALLTTVQDLAIWDRNFQQPRLGRNPQQLVTDMVHAAVLNDGSKTGYALGLMLDEYRGLPIVNHGGAVPGYNTFLLRFPEQKFAVIVLCNVGGGPARVAAKAVADIYLDGQFPKGPEAPPTRPQPQFPAKAARQPSASELAKFAGVYVNEELNARYRLKVSGDQLTAVVGYRPPLPFYAVDGKRFHNDENDLTLSFAGSGFVLAAGEVQGLKFSRAGH